jgi:hypothetical protein
LLLRPLVTPFLCEFVYNEIPFLAGSSEFETTGV